MTHQHGTVERMRCWFARCRSPLLTVVVLGLSGCAIDSSNERKYELQGQILAIRADANEVLIKHGDIKNFMPGMTMPFKVREAKLLDGKTAGDLVTATLVVGERDAFLATLEKTGNAPLDAAAEMPAASFVTPVRPGEQAPAATFTEWGNSATAVTFIYTRCPLPQFCPLMDRRFAEVQQAIKADGAMLGRGKLLSVSFDPDHDTPEVLQAHGNKLGADPQVWQLATAPPSIVDRFAAAFGVNVIREADRTITHNLRTAVVGPDGRVVSVYDGSDWTPDQVVADLRRALAR